MPGWDNTARRGHHAYLFMGSNPVTFAGALRARATKPRDEWAGSTLFINAWNEWAEGASIEPSERFGNANLATIADVHPARSRVVGADRSSMAREA
jgi:hypothetical protein